MQHHAERMARLKQLMAQLDRMHQQVANVAREVTDMHREAHHAMQPANKKSKRKTARK